MKKRLFASLLALSMALSLLPTTALADEAAEQAEPPAAVQTEEAPAEQPEAPELPAEEPEAPAEGPVAEPAEEPEAPAEQEPAEEPAAEPEVPAEPTAPEETPAAPEETPAEPEAPAETPAEPAPSAEPETTAVEPAQAEPEAETAAAPCVESLTITYNNGENLAASHDGSYVVTAANGNTASDYSVELKLSEGAVFTPTDHTEGNIYVAEASESAVKLRIDLQVDVVDIDTDNFALYLTSTDGTTWTGSFAQAGDLTVQLLGYYLSQETLTLPAGSLGAGSPAQTLVVNQDASESMLILCAPDAALYNVNYVYGDDTITWKLLAGMEIPRIAVETTAGSTFDGWYTDADYTTELSGTVSGDMTVYGKVTTQPVEGDFLDALKNGKNVTIDSIEDWNVFVQNSAEAKAGQVVTLGMDINCGGATYDSMTFAGSFNGSGYTISNANFRAVSTSSGDTCSGMFAKIGPGQVVANLTLQNVTAQYSGNYAGVLAGMVDGAGGSRTLVQNVQVRGSSASGRSAGGVAGFIRNATVRYCSSRDTTVTGLANGGGIVGLNNAKVEYCYSTTRPTALPSLLGGSAGGVVGKNVRGAFTEYCWATMKVVGGSGKDAEAGGTDIGAFEVDPDSTIISDYEAAGFNAEGHKYWILNDGDTTDFDYTVIGYSFDNDSNT